MNKISIMRRLAPFILSICLLAGLSSAVVYDGIDFRDGASAFADEVVSYNPTSEAMGHDNPSMALGIPDYTNNTNFVSLGDEGILVLKFTDNSLTTSGNNYDDLRIFEIGNKFESVDVYISKDGINWIYVGNTTNSTSGIDIDAYKGSGGVVLGAQYSYVKLVDRLPHESDTPTEGADIDAVGATSSKPPAPEGIDEGALEAISSMLPTIITFLILALVIAGVIGFVLLFKRRKA